MLSNTPSLVPLSPLQLYPLWWGRSTKIFHIKIKPVWNLKKKRHFHEKEKSFTVLFRIRYHSPLTNSWHCSLASFLLVHLSSSIGNSFMQGSAWSLNLPSSSNHLFSLLLFLIRVKLHLFLKNVRSSFTQVLPIIPIVLLSIRLIITTNSPYS